MSDPKPNFIKRVLTDWLQDWLPTVSRKDRYDWRGSEPSFMANLLDVDRLRQIIASAETGNVRDLFAIYRDVIAVDPHVQGEITKRKLALLGDTLTIRPADKDDPDDVAAFEFIQETVETFPRFLVACGHLLDGHLWPLAVTEKVFIASTKPGVRYDLSKLNAVPMNDIDYTTGFLMLRKLDPNGGYLTGELEEADPLRYIIHRGHMLAQADFWGGPFRAILFWWLLRSMSRDWWARFLERYGAPFIVGKYDQSDDASRSILTQAFQAATRIFGLVVSRDTEVELIEAATGQTGEAYERFMDKCNDEISKILTGMTSNTKEVSGLGSSGVAKQRETVRQDIRQFDGKMLAETLRDQLFRQLLDINGLPGSVKVSFGGLSPDEQTTFGELVLKLTQAGLEPTDKGVDTISEQVGIPLQRKAPPEPPPMDSAKPPPGGKLRDFSSPGLLPLAARGTPADQGQASVDRVAAEGAPDLSQAFRGTLAPVRRIIEESTSADDCVDRLRHYYGDWSADKIADLCENALTAFAANGASNVL
jgi:phage gp29-like protein